MNQLNEYLWNNPAPAPASDNSDQDKEVRDKIKDTVQFILILTSVVMLVVTTLYTVVTMWERL